MKDFELDEQQKCELVIINRVCYTHTAHTIRPYDIYYLGLIMAYIIYSKNYLSFLPGRKTWRLTPLHKWLLWKIQVFLFFWGDGFSIDRCYHSHTSRDSCGSSMRMGVQLLGVPAISLDKNNWDRLSSWGVVLFVVWRCLKTSRLNNQEVQVFLCAIVLEFFIFFEGTVLPVSREWNAWISTFSKLGLLISRWTILGNLTTATIFRNREWQTTTNYREFIVS